jgi:hypothetical protein
LKKILYIILFIQFTTSILAQHPTWQKVYKNFVNPLFGSNGYGIAPADSGNFYFTNECSGAAQVIKINPYGDTIWTKLLSEGFYGVEDGVSDGEAGCVFAGDIPDFFSFKINSYGNLVWQKKYNNTSIGGVAKIIRTERNVYAICGGGGFNSAIICTLDSIGNFLWVRQYPANFYKYFYTMCGAWNGGLIAAGIYTNYETDPGFGVVTRVDDRGNIIWEKSFTSFGAQVHFQSIRQINFGYILTGYCRGDTSNFKSRLSIIRIDTSGNTIFSKVFYDDTSKDVYGIDLNVINSNKYLVSTTCVTSAVDTVEAKELLVDSVGNIIKSKILNQNDWSYIKQTYVINENDIIMIGEADYLNPNFQNTWVVRTDTDFSCPLIGIKKISNKIPDDFHLYQNYPNPFNPKTIIKYQLAKNSEVKLVIYDVLGRAVTTLVNEKQTPGTYQVEWNGSDFASGIYFCKLKIENFSQTKKMVLIK